MGHWRTVTQDDIDRRFKVYLDRSDTDPLLHHDAVAYQWDRETHGGKCNQCGKEWRKVDHKIVLSDGKLFADYYLFEPDCACYQRCTLVAHERTGKDGKPELTGDYVQGCGHWLIEEKLRNYHKCMNCGGTMSLQAQARQPLSRRYEAQLRKPAKDITEPKPQEPIAPTGDTGPMKGPLGQEEIF